MLVFERSDCVWASHDVHIVWIFWQVVIMESINTALSLLLVVFNRYVFSLDVCVTATAAAAAFHSF